MVQMLLSHRIPEISFDTFECRKFRCEEAVVTGTVNTILIACEPL